MKFLIKAIKDKGSVDEESFNYELIIDRFEGMVRIYMNLIDLNYNLF